MASNYLQSHLDQLEIPSQVVNMISDTNFQCLIRVFTIVKAKWLSKVNLRPKRPKTITTSNSFSPISKANEKIKSQDSIQNEIEKAKAAKKLSKKLAKEMQEREQRKKEREQEMLIKDEQERLDQDRLKQEELKRQEELKMQKLREMKEKSEARKQQILMLKEIGATEYKKVIAEKPMFKKIEDNFTQEVLMPELEKKKAELAKKRILFRPLDHYDLADHSRRHEEMKKEFEDRRKQTFKNRSLEHKMNSASLSLKSRFTDAVVEEEKRKKLEKNKDIIEKKALAEKKTQYAELVKEMFTPTVDPFKQHEMQLIIEKLKHSIPINLKAHSKPNRSVSAQRRQSDETSERDTKSVATKKWKDNPMIPKPKAKKEPVLIDYLGERRKIRDNEQVIGLEKVDWEEDLYDENLTDEEKSRRLKAKADYMDKLAKKQEMKIAGSLAGIDAVNEVNDMYINSIKAKLAVLEQV